MTSGDYEEDHGDAARELAGRALELARSIGDKLVQSGSLNILAELAAEEGDEATANELYEQSLGAAPRARRQAADRQLGAHARPRRAHARGLRPAAAARLQEGFALARELGDTWSMSLALTNLGRVALRSGGDAAEAAKLFADGLRAREGARRQARRGRMPSGAGGRRRRRAATAPRLRVSSVRATRCSSRSARRRRRSRSRSNEQFVPPVRATLGDERFTAEMAAGRAEAPGEAIELALSAPLPPGLVRGLARPSSRSSRAAARLGAHGDERGLEDAASTGTPACTARGRCSCSSSRSSPRSSRRSSARTTTPARSCGRS